MSEKHTPGPIQRKGTFLWQEDSPSGAGMNLWSGLLSASNGYPEEHVERAARLFKAAPMLLEALTKARAGLSNGLWDYGPGQDEHEQCDALIAELDAAIAAATGENRHE